MRIHVAPIMGLKGAMALRPVGRPLLREFIALLTLASIAGSARAEKLPLGFRASFHGAIMVSKDQLLRLGYDNYGGLADVHVTYQPAEAAPRRPRGGAGICEMRSKCIYIACSSRPTRPSLQNENTSLHTSLKVCSVKPDSEPKKS